MPKQRQSFVHNPSMKVLTLLLEWLSSTGMTRNGRSRHCPPQLGLRWSDASTLSPVTIDETAAHVHTMTLWPSLKPSVCSMKPREENTMLMQSPAGAASQVRRLASRNPVRQQAAESPKQAPACVTPSTCQNGTLATTTTTLTCLSRPTKSMSLLLQCQSSCKADAGVPWTCLWL